MTNVTNPSRWPASIVPRGESRSFGKCVCVAGYPPMRTPKVPEKMKFFFAEGVQEK